MKNWHNSRTAFQERGSVHAKALGQKSTSLLSSSEEASGAGEGCGKVPADKARSQRAWQVTGLLVCTEEPGRSWRVLNRGMTESHIDFKEITLAAVLRTFWRGQGKKFLGHLTNMPLFYISQSEKIKKEKKSTEIKIVPGTMLINLLSEQFNSTHNLWSPWLYTETGCAK